MVPAKKGKKRTQNDEWLEHLANGGMTTMTLRIPNNLKNEGAKQARRAGMCLSAYMRKCMIDALAGE